MATIERAERTIRYRHHIEPACLICNDLGFISGLECNHSSEPIKVNFIQSKEDKVFGRIFEQSQFH